MAGLSCWVSHEAIEGDDTLMGVATFGLISLGIAAYAAVQDDIVAIPGQLRRQRERSF